MPADKERRKLIRLLMKRRPDLQYHRQWVFMKPLTHYLRAVLLISGWYGRYFRLESTVVPLFAGTTYLYFRRTRATLPPEQQPFKTEITEVWLDDPERAAQEISDIIEHEAFPAIADLTSPEAHRDHEHRDWRIAYLGKLLQTDRSQIPGLLHGWEEISVNALKLNKYWTPTPFPCEQGKGAAD